jgi:RES domain-containing protein
LSLTIWRIVKEKHAKTAFKGEGARLFGGRWNSSGTSMVYTAQTQSLAILEMLVHLDSLDVLKRYVLFGVEIEEALIASVDLSLLPRNWKVDPVLASVQAVGDRWAAGRDSVALSVPSALVPDERNFLLNLAHPDFSKLRIGKPMKFQFDPRLSKKRR